MDFIIENGDLVIEVVIAALAFFSVLARFTKNESDNKAIDWILRRVNNIGLRGGSVD